MDRIRVKGKHIDCFADGNCNCEIEIQKPAPEQNIYNREVLIKTTINQFMPIPPGEIVYVFPKEEKQESVEIPIPQRINSIMNNYRQEVIDERHVLWAFSEIIKQLSEKIK